MRKTWIGFLAAWSATVAVAACVGDEPTADGVGDGGSDASSGDALGGDGSSGDASIGDAADVDSGPKCGFPGEDCCTGPFAACNDGTTCESASKKCVVNDVWVVGDYFFLDGGTTIEWVGVSAHYDGTSWTRMPDIKSSEARMTSVWTGGGLTLASTDEGNVYAFQGGIWRLCGSGFACTDPATSTALTSILGFGATDIWILGSDVMFRCSGTSCTSTTSGLSGAYGGATLTGTSSTDLWLPVLDHAFHYNGTNWTSVPSIPAYAMWAHTPTDVWSGGTTALKHFDGTNWSPNYTIARLDGGAFPGTVLSMSGTTSDDAWAVGYASPTPNPYSAHWDGTGWTEKPLPSTTGQLDHVWAGSKVEVFASSYQDSAGNSGSLLKWDGNTWSTMTLPATGGQTVVWEGLNGSARPRP